MVDKADEDEDREGDDEKVDDVLDEIAVGDAGVAVAAEDVGDGEGEGGEVGAAEEETDEGHEDVGDERGDDFAEGATDDDTDGEVDDVATVDEGFEFVKEGLEALFFFFGH